MSLGWWMVGSQHVEYLASPDPVALILRFDVRTFSFVEYERPRVGRCASSVVGERYCDDVTLHSSYVNMYQSRFCPTRWDKK